MAWVWVERTWWICVGRWVAVWGTDGGRVLYRPVQTGRLEWGQLERWRTRWRPAARVGRPRRIDARESLNAAGRRVPDNGDGQPQGLEM
ncbi:hypothetical protein EDC01DRAFT_668240 [Geopyxis carbonaria]|nr:hypothetical protein EDC01DRAFT_668240 [Geopyxis carbonaria]